MTIETLQKLKDAGFPQEGEGRTIVRTGAGSPLYVPTFKELIEAFGDVYLRFIPTFYASRIVGAGSTVEAWEVSTNVASGIGNDREEALANLYIHINKK